jgi:hypothetical protein
MKKRQERWLSRVLGSLQLLTGLVALGGGLSLLLRPSGELVALSLHFLSGTPFHGYLLHGLALALFLGGSQLGAGFLAWSRHPLGGLASLFAGVLLIGWIFFQVALIGSLSPLQLVCLAQGFLTSFLAQRLINLQVPSRLGHYEIFSLNAK